MSNLPHLILGIIERYTPLLVATKGKRRGRSDGNNEITSVALSSLTEAVRALAAVTKERMKRTCYNFIKNKKRQQHVESC